MQYRTLGKTNWQVSAVSMGCWGIGGQWGDVSEREALAAIDAAREAGVNLFDTADGYGFGRSEELVGKALGKRPEGVYVATKVGNWGRGLGDVLAFKTIHSIRESCHASLYRLKTEVIDLYQCHIASPEHPDVFVEAFEGLKTEGKIRHYAISTNNLKALEAINANGACASCQINYSILARSAEKELLPYCREHRIGVLLRGPLAKGILTGKFSPGSRFDDQVRGGWNEGEGRERFLRQVGLVEKLKPLARGGRSLLDVALQFTLANPAVTCPIPGMKNADQARANAAAADGGLSSEELRLIDEVCPPGTDL
jgi:myo-inositol catabolism protein IolS